MDDDNTGEAKVEGAGEKGGRDSKRDEVATVVLSGPFRGLRG